MGAKRLHAYTHYLQQPSGPWRRPYDPVSTSMHVQALGRIFLPRSQSREILDDKRKKVVKGAKVICYPIIKATGLVLVGLTITSPASAQSIEVRVDKRGPQVVVDVIARVPVESSIAWDVLTDYNNMTRYVSSLRSSTVTKRDGNRLEVAQEGVAEFAFFSVPFSTLRDVDLVPQVEINSRLVRGELQSSNFQTSVAKAGTTTVISSHGEYVPNGWVPPGLGPSIIKSQTEKQYRELVSEMLRRQQIRGTRDADH